LQISEAMVDEIIVQAREELPNECCGIIAAQDGDAVKVFRAVNSEGSPVRYGLDPREQYRIMMEIEDHDWTLGAIYHSHTRSPAYPSQTDINLAFYPEAIYLIVSLQDSESPDVRGFHIVDGEVSEAEVSIT
jgi:proteasome lid subunit RPN8/RPN11